MISKAVVFDHVSTHFPIVGLGELGAGLASHQWDRDAELGQLTTVLADLHAEPDLVSWDFERLDATEGQISSDANMPLSIDVVRRGVLYRNLPDAAEANPRIQAVWDKEDDRGIWGDSGKIDALGAGFLLTAFIKGLDKGGFPMTESKAILRGQIQRVIDTECRGRSYVAIGSFRHLSRVMKYCELNSSETRLAQIRQVAHLSRTYGLELTDV